MGTRRHKPLTIAQLNPVKLGQPLLKWFFSFRNDKLLSVPRQYVMRPVN